MSILFPALLVLVLIAVVAMTFAEGLWSNAIALVNVVTAGLVATNFWEPVAALLVEQFPKGTYLWDFCALWGLFCVALIVMRVITDHVSRIKVRFPKIIDGLGSWVLAVWLGWVVVCFTTMTLHTAPLARNFMFEGFNPEKRMLVLAPDRQWLAFVQKMSRGSFARGSGDSVHMFDPQGDFLIKYASRRAMFASKDDVLVN